MKFRFESIISIAVLALLLAGCVNQHLPFQRTPLQRDDRGMWFKLHGSDAPNFAILKDEQGRLRTLAYDDDDNGTFDRFAQLVDSAGGNVPHLIIMLDSIPFKAIEAEYGNGRMTWFDPPVKVIPPFPTMSGIIFTAILHAPPLPGMINRYYDRANSKTENMIVTRAFGHINPWHERLDYRAEYWENGLAFLWPRYWFSRELWRAKRTFDQSQQPITIVYIASTAGMVSRFGSKGLQDVLNGVERLCCQILHERSGAVHISMLADHGHNLMPGTRVCFEKTLKDHGLKPAAKLRADTDVVTENDGMVNYIGMHTRQPAAVADALLTRPEVQLVMYRDPDDHRVIVRSAQGAAAIDHKHNSFRYRSLSADVLAYEPVVNQLRAARKTTDEGFVADREWFLATLDHEWPDGPPRIWKALDNLVTNTPDILVTLNDGYCTGLGFLELFISMASTHGGLNQINSASFVMSTTGRAYAPLRSDEIMPRIAFEWFEQIGDQRARAGGEGQ